MPPHAEHISVCICTYRRPALLRQLLSALEGQETGGLFDYSIVIVDNDGSESARPHVEAFARQSRLSVSYHVEPEQNIARARNRVVEQAKGDYLAFIDDDEYPNRNWLLVLHTAMAQHRADGVLAPVVPHFEMEPPAWVRKGGFFDRPTHPTGHVLDWRNTRTGNVFIKRKVFKKDRLWFDPAMGSGGEDRDFFKRQIEDGNVFVWCNEAPAFEVIPSSRWKRTVLLKRALVRGKMALNKSRSRTLSVLKSTAAVLVYTAWLPFAFFMGHHRFMRYLIRTCDHLGKVLAFWGIDWVKEKYVGA
jgi:glycosyltransferase involved in cell wall biosynthesis